jgi:hypothetical protein
MIDNQFFMAKYCYFDWVNIPIGGKVKFKLRNEEELKLLICIIFFK